MSDLNLKNRFKEWFETKAPEKFKEMFDKASEEEGILLEVCFHQFAAMVMGGAISDVKSMQTSLWTDDDIDAAYLIGCINVGSMDDIAYELNRLKEIGLKPHEVVARLRNKIDKAV